MGQKVRKGEELDAVQLKNFLQARDLMADTASELDIIQYSNGFSNLTYLLQFEGKELVLRRPPFGAVKRGHDMSREYKVLSNLYRAFPKSPQALAFSDLPDFSFYIMEKVEGIILTYKEAKKREIPSDQWPVIAHSWLDTFVELHQVDYKSIGLEDLGKPAGYVERQVSNWSNQYLKAATEEIDEAGKVMLWMEENQPREYDHSLIHNDYKYDNIVFRDDSWKSVAAVLDWEMCTLGDPLMDLGTSLAYWSTDADSDMIKKGMSSPTQFAGNPGRTEIVEMYARKSGKPVDNLVFYYVFGLFKTAVIVQQIYYRYSKGLTTDPRFASLNHAARLLCMIAWQSVQKKRIDNLF